MRKPIVGISMKTYQNSLLEAEDFTKQLIEATQGIDDVDLFYLPSIGLLYPLSTLVTDSHIALGSQNIGSRKNGAQTGEYSIEIALDLGVSFYEIGHAERKYNMGEPFTLIAEKVSLVLGEEQNVVLCIGDIEKCTSDEALYEQLRIEISKSMLNTKSFSPTDLVIAYEPVWAIGKSESAEYNYIWNSHKIIRQILIDMYGENIAHKIRIIYGGSVSAETAGMITSNENVDGVFVGRFGHDPKNFKKIVEIVKRTKEKKS